MFTFWSISISDLIMDMGEVTPNIHYLSWVLQFLFWDFEVMKNI